MEVTAFKKNISEYTSNNTPFLFAIDYKCECPLLFKLNDAHKKGFLFDIKGFTNVKKEKKIIYKPGLKISPTKRDTYAQAFKLVKDNIEKGNTYLLNLTFPSKIESNLSLEQIFNIAKAPYKLYHKDEFVTFSPECFVQIKDGFIYSYPMKGTIEANVENAERKLIDNLKELWEHNTIVDLIRNDLSIVADDITITKFRYIEKIKTNRNDIFQTSTEIRGRLPESWKMDLGEIILKLLPAGSITGAPKKKTIEIIEEAEIDPRNYYTGVFGIYDGKNLDSAVCIRFIEKKGNELFYKSGGGITFMSTEIDEYNELISKIYVPTF